VRGLRTRNSIVLGTEGLVVMVGDLMDPICDGGKKCNSKKKSKIGSAFVLSPPPPLPFLIILVARVQKDQKRHNRSLSRARDSKQVKFTHQECARAMIGDLYGSSRDVVILSCNDDEFVSVAAVCLFAVDVDEPLFPVFNNRRRAFYPAWPAESDRATPTTFTQNG
jgi:hypothetical protein